MRGKKAKALRRIVAGAERVAMQAMPDAMTPEQLRRARKRMLRHLKKLTK